MKYLLKISCLLFFGFIVSCDNKKNIVDPSVKYMEIITLDFDKSNEFYESVYENIDLKLFDLNKESAIVVVNSWSPYKLIAVPFKNLTNKYYCFYSNHSLSKPFLVEGTNKNVVITNTKGLKIGSISNNLDKSVLNDDGFLQIIQDTQSNLQRGICDCHQVDSCEFHQYDRDTNCGIYDFEECMRCAEDICDQDTKCRYGRTWTGPLYVISVAVHCAF